MTDAEHIEKLENTIKCFEEIMRYWVKTYNIYIPDIKISKAK